MEVPDIVLSGKYMKSCRLNLPRCFIYAWKRKEEYLYIGKTKNGISRLRSHPIINKIEPRLDEDIIEIYICAVDLELDDLEKIMVFAHQPKYNKQCNPNWINEYNIPALNDEEIVIPSHELAACRNAKEVKELIRKYK